MPARFGPETRFEVRPAPPAPFRATQETEFERLKSRLLARQLAKAPAPELNPPLRRAANDAERQINELVAARLDQAEARAAAAESRLEAVRRILARGDAAAVDEARRLLG